jgi:hypothetical protein
VALVHRRRVAKKDIQNLNNKALLTKSNALTTTQPYQTVAGSVSLHLLFLLTAKGNRASYAVRRKQELSQLEIGARAHSTSGFKVHKCKLVNGYDFANKSGTLNIRTNHLEFS